MHEIDWNTISELGLLEKINTEIMHPLGLAVSRNPETGLSNGAFISPDGVFNYAPGSKSKILTDKEVKSKISEIVKI
ncbi:DUF7415 domain-containing protein [Pseudoalteromonas luteoviolacea]|uniref:DUF7415 domain-containing protein n=1 Tax=Pseudoalteromonas luteoviolacea TaxID=43657 RepID=UPI001B38A99E|nr:hypothetical protein [Pseudoalteromonas luteoviolacea]MBQ4838820.1 hypothetical protein [Pseudoalteromonas luteoviolacea]